MAGGGSQATGQQQGQTGLPKYQNKMDRAALAQLQGLDSTYLSQVEGQVPAAEQTGAAANILAQNTLNGNYLNPQSNPYLQSYSDAAVQGLVDNYQNAIAPSTNAEFAMADNFGGSAMMDAQANNEKALANAIGNTEANIYEPAYQQERQIQANTINQVPTAQQGLFGPYQAPLNFQNQYNQGLMSLLSPYSYNKGSQSVPNDSFTPAQGVAGGLGLIGLAGA